MVSVSVILRSSYRTDVYLSDKSGLILLIDVMKETWDLLLHDEQDGSVHIREICIQWKDMWAIFTYTSA